MSSTKEEGEKVDYIGTANEALNTFCVADNIPVGVLETQKLLIENEKILSNGFKNITVDMLKKLDNNLTIINASYTKVSKEF